ncbi:HEAT repeat domain-containing protein [Halapricum sp. CBA1109]|uniref:HEAT repeat domain-containing protein n=1 Tax=Halapricum sp. CBA1109 TaxID=2668068 RepID=UPI001E47E69A|nr:HEAT repeat domain-containing protein [Halapricum sp. CBA1109]
MLSNVPTDKSHQIREEIVDELSATDDATVVVPLVEILEESTQTAQRRNTAWLLGRVTDGDHERVIEALVDCMDDDDQMTGQFAATSLAELDGETVEKHLLEVVEDDDRSTQVRSQAIFTLGKVGGEDSREALESLIDDTEDEQLRKRAFSAVSKLGGSAGDVL